MVVRYLTRDEIETINKFLAMKHGFKHCVLQSGNLDLCVESPKRIVFGQEIYGDTFEKAAALLKELTKLHPFLAGNKRTAYLAASIFLELNGYALSAPTSEAVNLSIETASCTKDVPEIFDWMKTCSGRSPWQPIE
jgi:death-on-curing protein